MTTLILRDLDGRVVDALAAGALARGCTLEDEAAALLRELTAIRRQRFLERCRDLQRRCAGLAIAEPGLAPCSDSLAILREVRDARG